MPAKDCNFTEMRVLNKMQFTASVLIMMAFLHLSMNSLSQTPSNEQKITIVYQLADVNNDSLLTSLHLTNSFESIEKGIAYLQKIPAQLQLKGFASVSIDTVIINKNEIKALLFLGSRYQFANLHVMSNDSLWVYELPAYKRLQKNNRFMYSAEILQQGVLNYLENNGYPFATVNLDSIVIIDNQLLAQLKIDKGIYYRIDSIRSIGVQVVGNRFLQQYLGIHNGSSFSKNKLISVDKALIRLPFIKTVQSSDLTMLGTGAVLNLYLQPKRSSYFNFIFGVQSAPAVQKKYSLTGDIHLYLSNVLLKGESFLFKWQQLQPQSPRLQLGYSQPYVFQSGIGFDFQFEMFKKDSNFLQWNTRLGIQQKLNPNNSIKAFLLWQHFNTLEGSLDTSLVKANKILPPNLDIRSSSMGAAYERNQLDNPLNPLRGSDINLTFSFGQKKINKNEEILKLTDTTFNFQTLYDALQLKSFQIRCSLSASQFFKINRSTTYKLSAKSAIFQSPYISRNELFQIGGNQILRGFDEESIYATQYIVVTNEYRLLFSSKSYLSFFIDMASVRKKYQTIDEVNNFLSGGVGLMLETKAGLLNVAYALGKRNDMELKWKDASKIHVGFINYF
jgi:outer membrane protein assembly factor BamA